MMDELLQQFLIEGPELVQRASDDLLALESRPGDATHIDGAFRAVHTLKGSVGLFDLPPLGVVLHAAEDLLGAIRDGKQEADRETIDRLLAAIGQTDRWLTAIETSGTLPAEAGHDASAIAVRLRAALGNGPDVATPRETPRDDEDWIGPLAAALPADRTRTPLVALRYLPAATCFFNGDDPLALVKAVPDILALTIGLREAPPEPADYDPFTCILAIELLTAAPLTRVKEIFRFLPDQVRITACQARPSATPDALVATAPQGGVRTLRIDAARIDRLADITDELVIAKNGLAELATRIAAELGGRSLARDIVEGQAVLDRLVGNLHRTVTAIRLLPVAPVLRRFPRFVRELAAGLGKEVDLLVQDNGVEADKSVVESLFDPLTHLLRNALDHGVEPAAERLRHGKPARARLTLTAAKLGDNIVIEVADDGRGIDPAVIRRAAGERRLMSQAALAALSDADILDLVFRPGFSTASRITDLSGRGVGMDAVRAAASRLGGKVSLASTLGAGTIVRLTLPLTLVLTRLMVVACAGERYGIPLDAVTETVRLPRDRIVAIRAGRAFVLRDRPVPLLSLAELLHLPEQPAEATELRAVVIRIGTDIIALAVDRLVGRIEALTRPMAGLLAGMPGVVGTTLMGDGGVMMVLDVAELVG